MTTKSASKLTGRVPTNGAFGELRRRGEAIARFVRKIEEQLRRLWNRDAEPRVLDEHRACATWIDEDDAGKGCGFDGEARCRGEEAFAITRVERRQTTAATDGSYGSTSKLLGERERVFGSATLQARVTASHENTGDGRFVAAHGCFELVEDARRLRFAHRCFCSGRNRCGRSCTARVKVRARIDEHGSGLIAMVALLATRVTSGARPRGGCMLDVDGHITAPCEVRHAHLAPRRDRFAGLRIGYGTRSTAELGAVDARFERAFVRRDNRQTEHVTSVRALGDECNVSSLISLSLRAKKGTRRRNYELVRPAS